MYILDFITIEVGQVMKNQSNTRKKMIAKIHIAQSQLGLDDDIYRDLLENTTGCRSCSEMTNEQLEKVLKTLKTKGFQDNYHNVGRMPVHFAEHRPMMNKLAVLLKETGKTWDYAHATANNMFGKEKVNLLNGDELHKLVSALQIYANRQAKKGVKNETQSA